MAPFPRPGVASRAALALMLAQIAQAVAGTTSCETWTASGLPQSTTSPRDWARAQVVINGKASTAAGVESVKVCLSLSHTGTSDGVSAQLQLPGTTLS